MAAALAAAVLMTLALGGCMLETQDRVFPESSYAEISKGQFAAIENTSAKYRYTLRPDRRRVQVTFEDGQKCDFAMVPIEGQPDLFIVTNVDAYKFCWTQESHMKFMHYLISFKREGGEVYHLGPNHENSDWVTGFFERAGIPVFQGMSGTYRAENTPTPEQVIDVFLRLEAESGNPMTGPVLTILVD